MLSEIDEEDRASVERKAVKRISECSAVEDAFPFRATKKQRPSGVTVAKREVENYRKKLQALLMKLREVTPFDATDAHIQTIAYADFQERKHQIENNLKFDWKKCDSWGAEELF